MVRTKTATRTMKEQLLYVWTVETAPGYPNILQATSENSFAAARKIHTPSHTVRAALRQYLRAPIDTSPAI
jgi:hypothetical protein